MTAMEAASPPSPPALVRAYSTLNHSPMFGSDIGLAEQVDAAATAGFDAISLDIFSVRASASAGALVDLASAITASGIGVLDVSALLLPTDADACQAAVAEMADLVSVLHPEWVLVKVDGASDERALERLRWAADGLDGLGVGLAIEPSPVSDMSDPIRALRLIQAAGAARSGVVLDTWHVTVGGWGRDVLDAVAPDGVAFVQLADGNVPSPGSDFVQATLHDRAAPGAGSFDLPTWLGQLAATGWRGPVCLEVLDADARATPVEVFATELMRASELYFETAGGPAAPGGR